jgi:hypothetical protein
MSGYEKADDGARSIGPALLLTAILAGLALPGAVLARNETQGFIYGRVTTTSDSVYEGRLRWNGDEEAFWGDHFNATKEDRPYLEDLPRRERERERERDDSVRILGIRIGSSRWTSASRSLVARFGDMTKIEVRRGDEATLHMKSGAKVDVDGGSNDLGGTVHVWDKEVGEVKLDWDRIATIELLPTPASIDVPVTRLHGKVKTDVGDFEGFVQWDQEECVSTDELDGDSADGDVSIPMGNLKSIERRSSRSSTVVFRSGREMVLDGTNDVDDDNRGIFVEDPRFGRVLVSWDAFERVDFSQAGPSGPAYDDFKPAGPLRGKVTDTDGKSTSGRIVFDMDESEGWEMLNGSRRDVEYNIPFSLIRSVVPESRSSSRVVLKGGEEVILEDAADVDDDNDGVLVIPDGGGEPTYVEWGDVERIDFDA